MDYNDELADLVKNTFLKDVIENVVKKEGIENYTLNVTAASAKGENFLGWLCKVKVSGEKEKVKTVLHLVLKIPPQSEIMREKMPLEIVYKTEIYVYNVILPELCSLQDIFNVPKSERFEYVKCFKADSERLKEYIVLEDMHARGFKMANRKVGLGVSHLKVVLKRMASYHALSFAYKKINPEKFSEMVTNVGGVGNYSSMKEFIVAGVDRAIGVLTDPEAVKRTRAFANEVMEKIHFYVSPESVSPYSVLCHGDFWNNNLLFRYEGEEPVEMVMVDWQVARYCSPVTDIAYFLFSITDYETRKEHLDSLLDYYYQCISKSLGYMGFNAGDLFPKAAYRDQINKILPFGLFMSFMLLPAVLGEQEDVPDMEEILANKETFVADDVKFVNNESSARFVSRINGIVQTFIDMNVV